MVTLNLTIRFPAYPCLLIIPRSRTMCLVSLVVRTPSLFTVTSEPSKCWKVRLKPNSDYSKEISNVYTKLLPSLDHSLVGTSTTVISKSEGAPCKLYSPKFRSVKVLPLGRPFGIGIYMTSTFVISLLPRHWLQVWPTSFPAPLQTGQTLSIVNFCP